MTKINLTNKVIVKVHPTTGEIITQGVRNPEWGSVRVESQTLVNSNGMITLQKRVAFARMQIEVANALIQAGLLRADKPLPIDGKIIVQESLEPFYEGQAPKINPTTQEEILYMGTMPIYRQAVFLSNLSAQDELIDDYMARVQNPIMATETIGEEISVEQTI